MQDINEYIESVWPDVLSDMEKIIEVNSIEKLECAKEGAPWGDGPAEALSVALEIADRLGLKTHNEKGYIGWGDVEGTSSEMIGTICHSDIVPAGNEWTFDPFKLTQKDGYLIGRGILDDKGPLILSFYAAKYFIDNKIELPYTLRCLIGTNEETGMRDVKYYAEHFEQPKFLFTPDASFPVCFGEKGHFDALFTSNKIEDGRIISMHIGTAPNAIPAKASCRLKVDANNLPASDGISFTQVENGVTEIVAKGIGGHAAMPENTNNAIKILINYLLDAGLYNESEKDFLEMERAIQSSWDGSSMGIHAEDEMFGTITAVACKLDLDDGVFTQTLDCRVPNAISPDEIEKKLNEFVAKYNCNVKKINSESSFYIDPESKEVKICIDAYNRRMGTDKKPFTIGGGTYARHFKRAVSFGPEEDEAITPDFIGSIHGPNEGVAESQLKDALAIYIDAISHLMAEI